MGLRVPEGRIEPVARLRDRNRDLRGDAARIGRQHQDPIGHQHRFLDVVCDHQDGLDRHPPLLPEIEQVGAQGLGGQHVERRKRLVHQQDLRLHDERAGEAEAALAGVARSGVSTVKAVTVATYLFDAPDLEE